MNDYAPEAEATRSSRERRPGGQVDGGSDHSLGSATVWPATPGPDATFTPDSASFGPADRLGGLLGRSPAMQATYEQIRRVAPSRASVLIIGESGAGKEVVARTLHQLSARADKPFVAVNCGAIPESLIEAELFGYERGSFTGAVRPHAGYFERAADGTLLLDDITEMSLEMQAKVLQVLESGRLLRVGGARAVEVRCRVLAATNRDPQAAIAAGRLRPDLLNRLAMFPLRVPALRERGNDAVALASHFLAELNADDGGAARTFSGDSLAFLREHQWPGNVRELRNAVQRAYILADTQLQLRPAQPPQADRAECVQVAVGTPLAEVERLMIVATLKRCGGNKTRTAAMLGVSLKTLYNRLNEYRANAVGTAYVSSRSLSGTAPPPMAQM